MINLLLLDFTWILYLTIRTTAILNFKVCRIFIFWFVNVRKYMNTHKRVIKDDKDDKDEYILSW